MPTEMLGEIKELGCQRFVTFSVLVLIMGTA